MTAEQDVLDALSAAQRAYAAATAALDAAESAARAAGVEVPGRELTLERLRIVEPDGTLRLVVGNSAVGEKLPIRGREVPHPGRTPAAGLLFVNDEGTECGGLVWSATGVHLSMDSYEQDQAVVLTHLNEAGVRRSSLEFVDRPAWSIADLVAGAHVEGGEASRMRLARETDGSVVLALRDARGRDRVRITVDAEDEPRIELLDADGNVVKSLD